MASNNSPDDAVESPHHKQVVSAIPSITEGHSIEVNSIRRRHRWLPVTLWIIFSAGLLVQLFGPHLKIANNAFVVPHALIVNGKDLHPAELVATERRNQLLSAILTLSGALGMAFYYRGTLIHSFLPQGGRHQRGPIFIPLKSYSRAQNRKQQNRM
jgi:hypothetical protein